MLITSHFIMFHVCFSFFASALCCSRCCCCCCFCCCCYSSCCCCSCLFRHFLLPHIAFFLPFPFAACRLPAMCLFLFRVRRQHGLSRRRSRVGELEPSPGPTGADIIMMVILMSVTNFLHDLLSATIPPSSFRPKRTQA